MKVKLNDFTYLPLPFPYIHYWQLTIFRLQMVYSVTQYTEFIMALCTQTVVWFHGTRVNLISVTHPSGKYGLPCSDMQKTHE